MATLISKATGNLTSAGTWALADVTSELDSEASSSVTTAAFVASSNFMPGAITIDAISVKVASRIASPTGTFTVELYNSTAASSVIQVTVNATDLAASGGWHIFPTGIQILLAANNYQIRVKTSVASTVTIYRDATGGNWSRQLRTTTTQAPGAGDKLIIAGEHTGAGTGNDFVVTMDQTASTAYGSVSFPQSISVNKRSTLTYGTAASTNYVLKITGVMKVFGNGTFSIGTSGTPIPSTSTATLLFNVSTNVDSGLEVNDNATYTAYGTAPSSYRALLNANAAIAATTLTTDISTGWKNGDQIAIASTTRSLTEGESCTLSIDASGTSLTISSGLTNAHSGTTNTQAEIINLTRNVKISGTSISLCAYVLFTTNSTSTSSNVEYFYLGSNIANKHGLEAQVTTGSATFIGCSFHEYFSNVSFGIYNSSASLNNISITDCNFYSTGEMCVYFSGNNPSVSVALTISNVWGINNLSGATYCIYTATPQVVISGCRAAGYSAGFSYANSAMGLSGGISNCVAHSCLNGFAISKVYGNTISNIAAWRTGGFGLNFNNCNRMLVDGFTSFGNTSGGITIDTNINCAINNSTVNNDASFNQPYGMYIAGLNDTLVISNSSFGATLGHSIGDIVTTAYLSSVIFHNTTFNSTTELAISTWGLGSEYFSQKHNGIANNNKRVAWEGVSTRDTTIFNTASPSLRLAPARAAVKLRSFSWRVSAASGNTITTGVYIRKSVVGDGTAYNGNQPRLVVKANPNVGILTDTVLTTASGSAGTWEHLTGTTAAVTENTVLEFYVDCDGTQGWINIDDLSGASLDMTTLDVWANGRPFAVANTDVSAYYSDPGQTNVRLGISYKFNSLTNNHTGTVRVPVAAQVKTGVVFEDADSVTGTYDGSDRWTDPGDNNVRSAIVYKANSLTNNKTGRVVPTVASTTKIGTTFEVDGATTGTYDGSDRWTDPGDNNVRNGVVYKANSTSNNKTGRVVPTIDSTTKIGVAFEVDGATTGTYDGSDRWTDPGDSNVRLGIAYKANSITNNKTGNVRSPATGDVRLGIVYDSSDSLTGEFGGEIDYHCRGIFSIDGNGDFHGTLFLSHENQPVTSSLISASYTVYDDSDVAVLGLTESGITPEGSGVFLIAPVSAAALTGFTHYRVKISIVHSSGTHESWTGFTLGEVSI